MGVEDNVRRLVGYLLTSRPSHALVDDVRNGCLWNVKSHPTSAWKLPGRLVDIMAALPGFSKDR
eukprot:8183919-Pyramimonas_sp.AAC.1